MTRLRLSRCLPFLALAVTAHALPVDARFRAEVLADNLAQPMHLARLDDGRIFVSEIAGLIRVWRPETRRMEEVGRLEVTTAQENGLLGMALDPDFARNGWMYLMHSPKDLDGQIISRFTVRDNRLDPSSRKDLLTWTEQRRECCHHAGTLRFGPDGCLYASTGDNTHPHSDSAGYAPIDERPGREPWDAQKSSANTQDLRGKILRIRPTPEGGYTIPEGNLFPPGTPGTRPEIYAMGFRNPWRFQIDPLTGILYTGDVGPDAGGPSAERGPRGYDTVSQVRGAGNWGWPYVRGGEAYRDVDFATGKPGAVFDPQRPINEGPNNTGLRELPPVQPPLIWYPSGASDRFPEVGSGGRTACAGPVFHFSPAFEQTGGLPPDYDGCLLVYDWQRPFLLWARLDAAQHLAGFLPFPAAFAVHQGAPRQPAAFQIKRPVDMGFGSDGCLYLLDYGETWGVNPDARLVRISYQWGNLAPEPRLQVSPAAGREPLEVTLDATGSLDRDGDALTYAWFLQPGDRPLGEGLVAKARLETVGAHTIELRARDAHGAEGRASQPVTVGNTPPEVRFVAPRDGDFFTPGATLRWQVEVRDADEGEAAAGGAGTLVTAHWDSGAGADDPPGLARMKQSDCFNCHAVEQPLVGPALVAIAEKYRGVAGAEEASVRRVLTGSSGVWGPLPMLPHPQHSADELHQMVRWIYDLRPGAGGPTLARGTSGTLAVPTDPAVRAGELVAIHTDAGRAAAPPLSTRTVARLRDRRMEAEAMAFTGSMVLGFGKASGGKGLGSIGHHHTVTFPDIPFDQTRRLTVRVASAGTGGHIEFHRGAADGPLLASIDVKPTGDWDGWVEHTVPLAAAEGRADVVAVFVKPGVGGGMMNLDWVRFDE